MQGAQKSPPNPVPDGRAGFTLLELLVALSLVGLIAVVLLGGLRFSIHATETGGERLERSRELFLVQSYLREQLGQALPLSRPQATVGAPDTIWFEGEPSAVSFVAPTPAELGLGGLYWSTLQLVTDGNSRRLVQKQRLFRPKDENAFTENEEEIIELVNGLQNIEIAYFGPDRPNSTPKWEESWHNKQVLPSLIRIRVNFPEGAERSWPDLVVALKIDGAPGCVYIQSERRCRAR